MEFLMKTRTLILYLYILALPILLSLPGCSSKIKGMSDFSYVRDGWDMFRNSEQGQSHDTISIGQPMELLWRKEFGGRIYGSPVINNGLGVLPALDKRLYYFNPETGSEIGSFKMDASVGASPSISENLLYVAEEKTDGRVRCININSGREVWVRRLGDVSSPIVISDRLVFVGNYRGTFFCLNSLTGEINWVIETNSPIRGGAAVSEDCVYFGSTNGFAYCVNLTDGSVKWKFETERAIHTSPAVSTVCYITSTDGNLYALDAATGDLLWKFATDGQIFSSPIASHEAAYFGSNDGRLYSISRAGRLIWQFDAGSIINSTPLVTSGSVVVGTGDGRIVFLERSTGEIMKEFVAKSGVRSTPVYYNGKVYVACTEKRLYCFGQPDSSRAEMAL